MAIPYGLPEDFPVNCRKAYFNVLQYLAKVDKALHSKEVKTFTGAYCRNVAHALSLFQQVERLYADCGFRPLLPACGSLPGANEDTDGNFALCAELEADETPVFYAERLRKRLEHAMLLRGDFETATMLAAESTPEKTAEAGSDHSGP